MNISEYTADIWDTIPLVYTADIRNTIPLVYTADIRDTIPLVAQSSERGLMLKAFDNYL